jgi:hypothetical protein
MRRYPEALPPRKKRGTVSRYKVEQRQIMFRGRAYHFVSYDGAPASKDKAATGPTWYLMSAGTRWEVMPHVVDQDPEEVDRTLIEWLERTIT